MGVRRGARHEEEDGVVVRLLKEEARETGFRIVPFHERPEVNGPERFFRECRTTATLGEERTSRGRQPEVPPQDDKDGGGGGAEGGGESQP